MPDDGERKHLRPKIIDFRWLILILIVLSALISCGPKPGPGGNKDRFQTAQRYIDEGNCKKAIGELRKIIEADDKNAAAYRKIGECYERLGILDSAVTYLEGAIIFNPRDQAAYEEIGDVYFERGMYHESMTWYDRALQIGYISSESFVKLGYIHQNWHEYDTAKGYYELAVRMDSTNSDAYYGLGVIDLVSGDTTAAEGEFEKSYDYGTNGKAAFRLGRIYAENGQYDLALDWLDKCIKRENDSDLGLQANDLKTEIDILKKSGQK